MTRRLIQLTPAHDAPPAFPLGKALPLRLLWIASQFALYFVAFQAYKMVRKAFIPPDASIAFDHARQVLHLEERLHLMFELDLQQWVLARDDWLIHVFNNVYAYYTWGFFFGMLFLVLMAPARYKYMRRAFFISMVIALPMYLIYPLAPPRFMAPHGWDFMDTMAVYGPNYFSDNGLVTANRYAAMPSMHVGWTTFFALCIMLGIPSKWGRIVPIMFAVLITLTVIITGNHYWLDAICGWMVIGVALVINTWVPYPLVPWLRLRLSQPADQLTPEPARDA